MTVEKVLIYLSHLFQFTVYIDCHGQEGLYNLYFHSCENYKGGGIATSMKVRLLCPNLA